jgi:hypothetical protein
MLAKSRSGRFRLQTSTAVIRFQCSGSGDRPAITMDFTFKAMSPWRSVLLGCRKLTQFVLPSLFLQMAKSI